MPQRCPDLAHMRWRRRGLARLVRTRTHPRTSAHFRALPPTRRHADTPTRRHADTPACELPPERDTRHRADVSGHARGPPRSVGGAPSIAPTPRADGCSPRRRARGAHQGGTRTGPARDHANHAPVAPPQHSILRCRGPWADLLLCHRLFDDALPLSNARVLLQGPSISCGERAERARPQSLKALTAATQG